MSVSMFIQSLLNGLIYQVKLEAGMEIMHWYNGTKFHLANTIDDCANFQPQKPNANTTPLRDQPATWWSGENNLSSLKYLSWIWICPPS